MFSLADNKGFTLIELIIATALISIIALAAFSVDYNRRYLLKLATNRANAQSEARFAMEHMVGTMREGNDITSDNGGLAGSDMRVRVNGDWKDYRLGTGEDETRIWFRPLYSSSTDEEYIADDIATLSFSAVTIGSGGLKYITITITTQEGYALISKVTLRNS